MPTPQLVALVSGMLTSAALAQSVPSDLKMQDVADPGTIEQVVVYEQGAVVTRTVKRPLGQGLWTLRISGLPQDAGASPLQASVAYADGYTGSAFPKLLGVEYAETPLADFAGTSEGVALANKVKDLQRQWEYARQDEAQADLQLKLVEQIGVRAAANATNDGATQALNLDAARAQLEFVSKERARLIELKRALAVKMEDLHNTLAAARKELEQRGGASRVERAALVMIGVPESGSVEVNLSYVMSEASWAPVYNVRSAGDRTGVQIEYDAVLQQTTGEDWTNVRLSLSTATPDRTSTPPALEPWYVDVLPPAEDKQVGYRRNTGGGGGGGFGGGSAGSAIGGAAPSDAAGAPDQAMRRGEIERLGQSAEVEATGTAVSFDLPRRVTVPSDASKSQRTRIATIDPKVEFVYTAQPIVTEDIFLRGDLENTSTYQMLEGKAQIFMGGDYIGETFMPVVAPADKFKVFFGPDRALRAKRQLVSKTTGSSGLFGGSQSTTWDYRVTVDNSTGRDAKIELFDRRPVSRNDKIEVELTNVSPALSTKKEYMEGVFTEGILRWDLTVPASARGTAAHPVTWKVVLTRPNSMKTTPLPPD